jgi:hypothetical protein
LNGRESDGAALFRRPGRVRSGPLRRGGHASASTPSSPPAARPSTGRDRDLTSVPEITRLLARIEDWKGQGPALGRAEAGRRLDEAHKLLDEISNTLAEMRRTMTGVGVRWCWPAVDDWKLLIVFVLAVVLVAGIVALGIWWIPQL